MDKTDELILDLLKGNARMSFEELGTRIGISRVAAKKRVMKLEKEGIIRGYNTCIYRDEDIILYIDIVTIPEDFEKVLKYVSTRTAYVRQIFRTSKPNHIQLVAVSNDVQNLNYLLRMIQKVCRKSMTEFNFHTVKEVIKDVYGGVNKYGQQISVSDSSGSDGENGGCACTEQTRSTSEVQNVHDEGDAGSTY